MEVQGYVLEGTPRLRCLSITEIVFGVVGTIAILPVAIFSRPYGSLLAGSGLILATLLTAAGSLGVHAVNQVRSRIVDVKFFRICGILNLVLCGLYCLELFIFILGGILLAAAPNVGACLLAHFGIYSRGACTGHDVSYQWGAEFRWSHVVPVLMLLALSITICALMVALTATAAKIARRNQAVILAGPSAGYPLLPPGNTQNSAVTTQWMPHA